MPKKSVKKKSVDSWLLYRQQPITHKICVAQKNVIEEKLLKNKRSIRRGIYLFQIRSGAFLCIITTLAIAAIPLLRLEAVKNIGTERYEACFERYKCSIL